MADMDQATLCLRIRAIDSRALLVAGAFIIERSDHSIIRSRARLVRSRVRLERSKRRLLAAKRKAA